MKCSHCNGTGKCNCPACYKAAGKERPGGYGTPVNVTCSVCGGSGRLK